MCCGRGGGASAAAQQAPDTDRARAAPRARGRQPPCACYAAHLNELPAIDAESSGIIGYQHSRPPDSYFVVIGDFTSHALSYQSITTAEVLVRVYGNTAVETGRSTMVGQDRGKAVPRENRFTRVWVMTDGRWQLVANHYSPMTTK